MIVLIDLLNEYKCYNELKALSKALSETTMNCGSVEAPQHKTDPFKAPEQ